MKINSITNTSLPRKSFGMNIESTSVCSDAMFAMYRTQGPTKLKETMKKLRAIWPEGTLSVLEDKPNGMKALVHKMGKGFELKGAKAEDLLSAVLQMTEKWLQEGGEKSLGKK